MPASSATHAREYETIYIMRPSVDPDEADRIAAKISETVEKMSGKLTKVDNWGKRKLAYPINKATRGVFVYFKYVGFGGIVAEIERNLRMIDSVIRFQTVVNDVEDVSLAVTVDPEEIKFRRLEITEDEAEPALEARLGMIDEPKKSRHESDDIDGFDDGFGDDDANDDSESN